MNGFGLGTPLNIQWHLTTPDGRPFALQGLTYTLKYKTGRGESVAKTTSVPENAPNVISWIFPAKEQYHTGVYDLTLAVYRNGQKLTTLSYIGAFALEKYRRINNTPEERIIGVSGDEHSAQIIHLTSACEFYLYTPVEPTAGSDGYWYVNGHAVTNDAGEKVPTSYVLRYEPTTKHLLICEGNSNIVVDEITALSDAVRDIELDIEERVAAAAAAATQATASANTAAQAANAAASAANTAASKVQSGLNSIEGAIARSDASVNRANASASVAEAAATSANNKAALAEQRAQEAKTAADAANGILDNASQATDRANAAAGSAEGVIAGAREAANLANEKAALADQMAAKAKTNADAADKSSRDAQVSASLAEANANLAKRAAETADAAIANIVEKTTQAEESARQAAESAAEALAKAQQAGAATQAANDAANRANEQADAAEQAASAANNVDASLDGNMLTVVDREGNVKTVDTKGPQGEPGKELLLPKFYCDDEGYLCYVLEFNPDALTQQSKEEFGKLVREFTDWEDDRNKVVNQINPDDIKSLFAEEK